MQVKIEVEFYVDAPEAKYFFRTRNQVRNLVENALQEVLENEDKVNGWIDLEVIELDSVTLKER